MKKLLSIISSGLVVAFALQSCTTKVDTAKEWAQIDSAANVKVMAYRDSLKLMCMNNIMTLAQARADSMMQAAMKKSPGSKPKPKPVTPPKPASSDKLGDKLNENSDAKLKEKLGTPTEGEKPAPPSKLKSKLNTTPTPTTTPK